MNRILFEEERQRYLLDPKDARFEHVRGVLRMKTGDSFDVGVINGRTGKAKIMTLNQASMEVVVEWGERPDLPPDIRLLIGMCRPATVRKILSTVPTLGVRELHFVRTGRTDPAYTRSSIWKETEWRPRLIEGVEQSFDTYLPRLESGVALQTALEQLPENGIRVALDVYEGSIALSRVAIPPDEPVTLAIGPERGWSATDRNHLKEKGFSLVSLNERVLRVETAVVVGLTLVLAGMGIY